jgi:hypothetical protein
MIFEPVTLEGNFVRLEPLTIKHRDGLRDAIVDGELWKLFVTMVPHMENIDDFIGNALVAHEAGDGIAFATIDKRSGNVAGSTRFMKASFPNTRLRDFAVEQG